VWPQSGQQNEVRTWKSPEQSDLDGEEKSQQGRQR